MQNGITQLSSLKTWQDEYKGPPASAATAAAVADATGASASEPSPHDPASPPSGPSPHDAGPAPTAGASPHDPDPIPVDERLNRKIVLWKGDVCRLTGVHCVGCPVNSKLNPRTPFARMLLDAAGEAAVAEGREEHKLNHAGPPSQARWQTAETFTTTAGKMPAQALVHTVTPSFNPRYRSAVDNALHYAYTNCLSRAVEEGFTTVALPPMVLFAPATAKGFPREEGLHVIARALRAFLARHGDEVDTVALCVLYRGALADWRRALRTFFPRGADEAAASTPRLKAQARAAAMRAGPGRGIKIVARPGHVADRNGLFGDGKKPGPRATRRGERLRVSIVNTKTYVEPHRGNRRHTKYVVRVWDGEKDWCVRRRYSEFHALRDSLGSAVGHLNFPKKVMVGKLDPAVVQARRTGLRRFLRDAWLGGDRVTRAAVEAFLAEDGITQQDDAHNTAAAPSAAAAARMRPHRMSAPAHLVTDAADAAAAAAAKAGTGKGAATAAFGAPGFRVFVKPEAVAAADTENVAGAANASPARAAAAAAVGEAVGEAVAGAAAGRRALGPHRLSDATNTLVGQDGRVGVDGPLAKRKTKVFRKRRRSSKRDGSKNRTEAARDVVVGENPLAGLVSEGNRFVTDEDL